MSPLVETFVGPTNTITLVCGGFVTLLASRAYRRTGAIALGALAAGLGFITVGALVAGALHQLFGVDFATGVGVQSLFTAVGFGVVAYSLYANWQPSTGVGDRTRLQ